MLLMPIEFLLNFCYTALYGAWTVTHTIWLRYSSMHSELRVYGVMLTGG